MFATPYSAFKKAQSERSLSDVRTGRLLESALSSAYLFKDDAAQALGDSNCHNVCDWVAYDGTSPGGGDIYWRRKNPLPSSHLEFGRKYVITLILG